MSAGMSGGHVADEVHDLCWTFGGCVIEAPKYQERPLWAISEEDPSKWMMSNHGGFRFIAIECSAMWSTLENSPRLRYLNIYSLSVLSQSGHEMDISNCHGNVNNTVNPAQLAGSFHLGSWIIKQTYKGELKGNDEKVDASRPSAHPDTDLLAFTRDGSLKYAAFQRFWS